MIAPLHQIDPETAKTRRRLREAYRVVTSAFLPRRTRPTDNGPPISAWRAWLFAGWVIVVTTAYFASMLGLL